MNHGFVEDKVDMTEIVVKNENHYYYYYYYKRNDPLLVNYQN